MSTCITCPTPHLVDDGQLACMEVTRCPVQLEAMKVEGQWDRWLRKAALAEQRAGRAREPR